jgi:glucose/arabinose dehydrogenase
VDAAGVADSAFTDVNPRVTTLTLTTSPAGLQVTLDGQPRTTPYAESAIVGMERPLGIPTSQRRGDAIFTFASWSDGGAASHSVLIPAAPLLLTATFDSTVAANTPPTVTLTAPAAGASVTVGDAVTLTAATTDSDGTVQQVEFFADGASVGVDAAVPFTVVWTPTSAGARTLTARATDDNGAATTSAGIGVTVQAASGDVIAPVATLVTPAAGTLGLTGAVPLTATATDNVGVTAVEFQVDGELLASDDTAPYEATIPSTAAYASGAHVVRARARDAAGNWSSWSASTVTFGGTVALPAGFVRTTVASGLNATPTAMAFAPDGRLFVAEQTGALRVVKNGALLSQPFLTLAVDAIGERGLLGIAFHPAFQSNGWIYLYYTTTAGGIHNRISRFTANGDVVAAGSEVVLVDLPGVSDSRRHNGGAMRFGPDGMLYVAVGDDAVSANSPSLTVPFGKMLRFAPDGSIPSDNPFYGATTGVNRAIWAKGLRNPYTFDIHPTTGRMHINDVGESTWEEINLGRAGADYGWPTYEGPTTAAGHDSPLFAYRHEASPTLFEGSAVVGAAFYTPSTPMFGAAYVDDFFFADYVSGWIYRLDAQADWAPYAFAQLGAFTTGITVGNDGALYVLVGTRVDRIAR